MAPTVPAPTAVPFTDRNKIFYRPAVLDVNRFGQPVLRPSVQVSSSQHGLTQDVKYVLPEGEQLPPPEAEYVVPETWSAPIVDGPYEQYGVQCAPSTPRLGPLQEALCRVRACLNGPRTPEPGIGTERVGNAISFLDTTQPMNNCRLRLDAASNYESPDRAEYFWAKIGGGGPSGRGGEIDVDYQDVRMYWEIGGEKFSVGTDIPIRVIDPVIYDNSGGLGDINIQTKILFLDGRRWQMSNLLRVYIPSGDRSQGIGTGHASIEPGLAWRYKWSDVTYLHANLKFWVPLGADQLHGGEVLDYGLGLSHVLYDGDRCAIMPTFEMVGYYFMDGQVTLPIGVEPPVAVEVDSEGILNIHPGIRWVWDNGNDCGVREFGLFGGYSVTSDSLYETLLRAEFRWIW